MYVCLCFCQPNLFVCLFVFLSNKFSLSLTGRVCLSICLSVCLCVCVSVCLSVCLSFFLSAVFLSFFLSTPNLSVCLCVSALYVSICLQIVHLRASFTDNEFNRICMVYKFGTTIKGLQNDKIFYLGMLWLSFCTINSISEGIKNGKLSTSLCNI